MEPSACSPDLDPPRESRERRIVAVVLPQLPCELLGDAPVHEDQPLGVVIESEVDFGEIRATVPLGAVNEAARRLGVNVGQTIAEARALVAGLRVRRISRVQIEVALQTVAEVALAFGTTASIRLGDGAEIQDTVWVDISGVAHLFDGERQLVTELDNCVRALGHETQIAIAGGPWLARALARWGATRPVRDLPIVALPLDAERVAWLARLGVHTWGDLGRLPRQATAARLGEHAVQVLDLCEGHDTAPLVAHRPPRILIEERSFEDAVSGLEPLAFVLRGLTSRIAARLAGRGEAAQALVVTLQHDRSVAQLRGVAPQSELRFDLSPPLYREHELYRLIMSRLERTSIGAPTETVRLSVPLITRATTRQLDFLSTRGVDELPVLLAELAADIGSNRVGVLRVVDSLRPEAQSVLGQAVVSEIRASSTSRPRKSSRRHGKKEREAKAVAGAQPRIPTRLLPRPIPLRVALREGSSLFLGRRAYTIERITFDRRLDAVEWWSRTSASRDYFRLLLRGASGVIEALVFVDRRSNARFLQAIYD
jgi:protein ImuB